jgi:hypothetical protein
MRPGYRNPSTSWRLQFAPLNSQFLTVNFIDNKGIDIVHSINLNRNLLLPLAGRYFATLLQLASHFRFPSSVLHSPVSLLRKYNQKCFGGFIV